MTRVLSLLIFAILAGCAGVAPLPPADLGAPGWTIWTGQASWRPGHGKPSLAGDLVVGLRDDGERFVNLTKTALPLFTARAVAGQWSIEFAERDSAHAGRGDPPARFVWFALPGLLAGTAAAPSGWQVEKPSPDETVLDNPRTGERVRIIVDE